MPDTTTTEAAASTTSTNSGWKKTASVACLGVGALLIAAGNYFGGSLDLSSGIMESINAIGGVLTGLGVGGTVGKVLTSIAGLFKKS